MSIDKPQEVRFWHSLICSVDLLRELCNPSAAELVGDVSYRQLLVMKKVWMLTEDTPSGITLKRLSEELGLTPGTVSELVDTLVRKGSLQRIQNPSDRREVLITLTERSMKYVEEGTQKSQGISRTVLSNFSEDDRTHLVDALEKIQTILNELKKTANQAR